MSKARLFACGGVSVAKNDTFAATAEIIPLSTKGEDANVNLRLEDMAKVAQEGTSPRLIDLLEIAAYVYAGDASTTRQGAWRDESTTESWERQFKFIIPVRDFAFWQKKAVKEALVSLLTFLSNDIYEFEFRRLNEKKKDPKQLYFEFGTNQQWPFQGVDRVLMFSGGLDSLAGAVETASKGQNLVLVSHRPVSTLSSRQLRLFKELKAQFPVKMIHVPVWVNKDKKLGREHTQRTRSFLFTALGMVVADSVQAKGVRFFENGVVSLNLPVADEVLRARASRTTHPHTLVLLQKFCSLVAGRLFIVDNPYIFMTKTEVVGVLQSHDAKKLVSYTCSCAHTGFFQSKTQWHCGACSQCIDRRFAILANKLEEVDSETDYVTDVFTGPRRDGYEVNMAVDFVRHGLELYRMSEGEVAHRFNYQISTAVKDEPKRRESAEKLVHLHKRHGQTIREVLNQQLAANITRFTEGDLAKSSMLAMVTGQAHTEPSWNRYCDRINKLLSAGVPVACKTHKPKNEPHLQEICDSILKAHDEDLVREFPFMQWSSGLTKPDWSFEPLLLWVELKYIRKKTDVRPITEDIAADITKYGDNNRRVLYVVYDPGMIIIDRPKFSEQITRRPTMRVHFIP